MFRILLAASALLAVIIAIGQSDAQLSVGGGAPYGDLACYQVSEPVRFRGQVTLTSALEGLEIPSSCKVVGRSVSYCVPVRTRVDNLRVLDGANAQPADIPGPDQGDGRLCYQLKCKHDDVEGPLRFEDRFGQHPLRNFSLKALCTTARALPNITTTTTTTSTTIDVEPCATVTCDSQQYCRRSCDDRRVASCVSYKTAGENCGGFVPPCEQELCKAGLECLSPPDIPDALGVCVDPESSGCERDSDCGAGQVCESGPALSSPSVCVPGCHDDRQCSEGQQCRKPTCLTTPCPGICVDDETEAECTGDGDCGGGEICEPGGPGYPASRVCVQGCRNDDACMEGQHCQVAVCLTTPCPARCVDNPPDDCGACLKDADCGQEGLRCNAVEACLRSCECPKCAVCAGNCVPRADASRD